MSRLLPLLVLLIATAAGVGGFWFGRSVRMNQMTQGQEALVGRVAPDLKLTDLHGNTVSLTSFRGKTVLVNFWATWCPPCVEELPLLDALSDDMAVVGIAVDLPEAVPPFLAAHPVRYPIWLADQDQSNPALAFGNQSGALPYSALLDAEGRIVRVKLGQLHPEEIPGFVDD
ncbi:TlpA family protein disulfide reductase [Ahniella affigens]|uniref:TlpA family protein disulfide reductase n=1 Tax=Ahniella affigens TaxID=2021234 RepID=UPI0011B23F27|nr:TlpA disulfide reductase family protein [Ahniella affigens]